MSEVTHLRPVKAIDETAGIAKALRDLADAIENGKRVRAWYVLTEELTEDPATVQPRAYDSGITTAEAVCMLEFEKLRVAAMAGVLGTRE